MARRSLLAGGRLRHLQLALVVVVALSFLASAAATSTAHKTGQVAVFWGRDKNEGTLREACDTGLYTTVLISFYSVFGHGRYWGDLSGHPLTGVGDDIKHCQQSRNVLVLLSIGGNGGADYSLPSYQSAAEVADNIWNAHLGGSRRGVFRPFGDAVLDGVDFFIDRHGAPDERYDELARRLALYGRHGGGGERSRKAVLLTATPRCGFPPDRRVERALATGLFERLHVRFYDDAGCSYNHAGLAGVMAQWTRWTARYPGSKVYLGLAAGNVNGKGDMVNAKKLYYDLLPSVQKAPNYGGVMLWDRSHDKHTGYGAAVKHWA